MNSHKIPFCKTENSMAKNITQFIREKRMLFSVEIITAFIVLASSLGLILIIKIAIPQFGSPSQIAAIIVTSIFLVIASCGQGLTILLGGIDLSIGVVMGIAGMMIAGLTNGSNNNLMWALPIVIISCTGIGIINGLGIAFLNIPPLLMTLAMGTTFFGIALGATYGGLQKRVAPALEDLMSGHLLGLPIPVFLIAFFVVAAVIGLNRTGIGRKFYAMGSNLAAARITGVPISGLTVAA